MKHGKKILSLILALVMVLGLGVTALAAEGENTTVTVTVPDSDSLVGDHSFYAYQIFKGTQSEENILGDIDWGDGINAASFVSALKSSNKFGDPNPFNDVENNSAAKVADVLSTITSRDQLNEVARIAFNNKTDEKTKLNSGENQIPAGYYLIVDGTKLTEDSDAVLNAALLQATQNVTIQVKTDKPEAEKKVKENDKTVESSDKYEAGYNDVADYNIGDTVPFAFYSKVPDMTYYDTYQFIFHDTMSDGLTFIENSVEVLIGGTPIEGGYTITTNTTDGCTFEVIFNDLKTVQGAVKEAAICIKFNAELNENAVIGTGENGNGNTNTMQLEYSNNPNEDGTGKTPDDTVFVFTYELDTTKVDGTDNSKKLNDAEFKLYRQIGETKEYVKVDENHKVTGWTSNEEEASTLISAGGTDESSDGLFKVIGLDAGTYYLQETKAPAGYNVLADPIEVIITATTNNTQDVTNISGAITDVTVKADSKDGTGNLLTGTVSITVENNKGATLPETGGIGTTIFYVVGGILVLGCGVILVTRKRMSKEK